MWHGLFPPRALTSLQTLEQPAYRLAVQVCNSTADKLTRHVSQYFTEIIVTEREDDFTEIRTAHELIKRLYHSCPTVLPTVIPQLEEELQAEDLQLRLIVTQVLGEMFADQVGGLELTKKYPSTWNVWLKRKNDRAPAVRLKFVEAAQALLGSPQEQRDAIEEAFAAKLLDPDDKVRAAVCRVYAQLDYETALHHVKADQLRAVAGRGVDKKVRRVAPLCPPYPPHLCLACCTGGSAAGAGKALCPGLPRNVSVVFIQLIKQQSTMGYTAKIKTPPPFCSSGGSPMNCFK